MAFVKQRDFNLFQSINRELINDFVETPVIVYKPDISAIKENVYGESEAGGKSYFAGARLNAYIDRSDNITNYEGFGSDVSKQVQFRFMRKILEEINFVVQVGDIISYDDAYFEVDSIVESQPIAGNINFKNAVVCDSHMVRRSKLNIEDIPV
jgi:hypothetical protein